jgi:hypothetical protein
MNPVECIEIDPRAEAAESPTIRDFERPQRSAVSIRRDARLRYVLLVGTAVFALWLGYTVRSSIDEIDREVEMIRLSIVKE